MKMDEIKKIARKLEIKPGKLNKTDLVRSIQSKEGNYECFASVTEASACDQTECLWRSDCFSTAKKAKAA